MVTGLEDERRHLTKEKLNGIRQVVMSIQFVNPKVLKLLPTPILRAYQPRGQKRVQINYQLPFASHGVVKLTKWK